MQIQKTNEGDRKSSGKFSQYLVLNPHQTSPRLWQEIDRFKKINILLRLDKLNELI